MKTQLQKHTSVFAHCRSLFVFLAGLLTLISKTELQGGCCVDCDVVMYLAVIPFPIRRKLHVSTIENSPFCAKSALLSSYKFADLILLIISPFKPNGISHHYHLDQSIFRFKVVGWYFSFLFKF